MNKELSPFDQAIALSQQFPKRELQALSGDLERYAAIAHIKGEYETAERLKQRAIIFQAAGKLTDPSKAANN